MTTKSNSDYIYDDLRNKIITLEYKPGEKISEATLAEIYGTSRTTVKKSLVTLTADKLVEVRPQRGTYVTLVDLTTISQLQKIRLALEYSIIGAVRKNITKKDIEYLQQNIDMQNSINTEELTEKDITRFWNLDNKFHERLFTIADQKEVWSYIVENLHPLHRYRVLSFVETTSHNIESVQHEHSSLFTKLIESSEDLYDDYYDHIIGRYTTISNSLKIQYPEYFYTDKSQLPF